MRSLFALLGGALVAFLALGWYFNWYTITKSPADGEGHHKYEIDINTKKVSNDVQNGVKAGTKKIEGLIDKTPSTPGGAPSTAPGCAGGSSPPPPFTPPK